MINNIITLIIFALSIFTSVQIVSAIKIGDNIYPINSTISGIDYPTWTGKWQQWLMAIPQNKNPAIDTTGKFCSVGQNGPVWFLAGTTGGSAERTCEIPYGKSILFPIVASICDEIGFPNVKDLNQKIDCAKADNNNVINLKASIDGEEIPNLSNYRVTSPLFEVAYPEDNFFGYKPGVTTAVGDGYWVFLKPLDKGDHNIHFSSVTPPNPATGTMSYVVDVSYKIKIK